MVLLSIRNKQRDLELYPDDLGPLVGEFDDDISSLMDDLEAGNIDADEWRDRFAKMMAGAIALAYFVGLGSNATLSADQRAAIETILAEQLAYLDKFYDVVKEGLEFDPAWRTRASMYADAVTEPFWEARTWPWPLPAYPGDGTSQCLTHCRCDWVIHVIDETAGDADAFWMLGPVEHCQTCLERARRWSPLQIRGWKLPLYDTINKSDARALERLRFQLVQTMGKVAHKHLAGRHDQKTHGRRFGEDANAPQLLARQRSEKRRIIMNYLPEMTYENRHPGTRPANLEEQRAIEAHIKAMPYAIRKLEPMNGKKIRDLKGVERVIPDRVNAAIVVGPTGDGTAFARADSFYIDKEFIGTPIQTHEYIHTLTFRNQVLQNALQDIYKPPYLFIHAEGAQNKHGEQFAMLMTEYNPNKKLWAAAVQKIYRMAGNVTMADAYAQIDAAVAMLKEIGLW